MSSLNTNQNLKQSSHNAPMEKKLANKRSIQTTSNRDFNLRNVEGSRRNQNRSDNVNVISNNVGKEIEDTNDLIANDSDFKRKAAGGGNIKHVRSRSKSVD